jgi:hypothetical protein
LDLARWLWSLMSQAQIELEESAFAQGIFAA